MASIITALFAPGQMVRHKTYGYLGLVYDVDPEFNNQITRIERLELIETIDEQPWYHVLVDGEEHASYVSEDNLEAATGLDELVEFRHPLLNNFFETPDTGAPSARRNIN